MLLMKTSYSKSQILECWCQRWHLMPCCVSNVENNAWNTRRCALETMEWMSISAPTEGILIGQWALACRNRIMAGWCSSKIIKEQNLQGTELFPWAYLVDYFYQRLSKGEWAHIRILELYLCTTFGKTIIAHTTVFPVYYF
jgi:hypothetical protein